VVEFAVPDRRRIADAVVAVTKMGEGEPHADTETGVIYVGVGGRGSDALIEAVRSLDAAGIETHDLRLRRPSLDDVFLALTGHAAEEEEDEPSGRRRGRRNRRRGQRPEDARVTS
jgi:ABC-2 type transport system ATP-binding protein